MAKEQKTCPKCRKKLDEKSFIKDKKKHICDKCFDLAQPKPKVYYEIKVESLLPSTITYRILAESPEQAVEMIKNSNPISVKHKLIGKKDIKLTVYNFGCSVILFIKNFIR
jgi:hypothetical protein